jgi:hypothetical protein
LLGSALRHSLPLHCTDVLVDSLLVSAGWLSIELVGQMLLASSPSLSSLMTRSLVGTKLAGVLFVLVAFVFQTALLLYLAEAHAVLTQRHALESRIGNGNGNGSGGGAGPSVLHAEAGAGAVAAQDFTVTSAMEAPAVANAGPDSLFPVRSSSGHNARLAQLALIFPSAAQSDHTGCLQDGRFGFFYHGFLALQLALWLFFFAQLMQQLQSCRDPPYMKVPSPGDSANKRGLVRCSSCALALAPRHSLVLPRPWWRLGFLRGPALFCPSCAVMPLNSRLISCASSGAAVFPSSFSSSSSVAPDDGPALPGAPFVSGELLWYVAPAPLKPVVLSSGGDRWFQRWLHNLWLDQVSTANKTKNNGKQSTRRQSGESAAAAASSLTAISATSVEGDGQATDALLLHVQSTPTSTLSSAAVTPGERSSGGSSPLLGPHPHPLDWGDFDSSLPPRPMDNCTAASLLPGFEVIFRRYCDSVAATGAGSSSSSAQDGDCLVSLLNDLSSVLRTNARFLRRAGHRAQHTMSHATPQTAAAAAIGAPAGVGVVAAPQQEPQGSPLTPDAAGSVSTRVPLQLV